MIVYSIDGTEVELEKFNEGSIVIMRVLKKMSKTDFKAFCKINKEISEEFNKRGITVVFCPEWICFKEFENRRPQ